MSRLIYIALFCFYLLLNHDSSKAEDTLKHDHEPSHREKNSKPGKVTTEIQYRFGTKSYPTTKDNPNTWKQEIIKHAQQQVECDDTTEARGVFDKPLPVGWLYSQFSDTTTGWQNYFDTSQQEIWVLPNVHCNKDRTLTAISWMRSGKKGAMKENKDMIWRFRANNPPFYSSEIVNNNNTQGVYCNGWGNGWLFEKNKNRKEYIDTLKSDELFTIINIYCHQNHVIYMHHGYAGHRPFRDFADDKEGKDASDLPFKNIPTPSPATDGSIGCSWQGWLLKDSTNDTWEDTGADGKQRWSFEKYFALDRNDVNKKDKRWMLGRVINPFCSKTNKQKHGVVTRIRTYCFYPPKFQNRNLCSNL